MILNRQTSKIITKKLYEHNEQENDPKSAVNLFKKRKELVGENIFPGKLLPVSTKIFMFIRSRTRESWKSRIPSRIMTSEGLTWQQLI